MQMIGQFFDVDLEDGKVVVKEGDTLELGSHTLHFVMAPMVHWPEVMVSYMKIPEKILFSADAFGTFWARTVTCSMMTWTLKGAGSMMREDILPISLENTVCRYRRF